VVKAEKFMKNLILTLPRTAKIFLVMCSDYAIAIVSLWLAYYLKTEGVLTFEALFHPESFLPASLLAFLMISILFPLLGIYKATFRFSGTSVLRHLLSACSIYGLFFFIVFSLFGVNGIPISIGILHPILFSILMISFRIFASWWLINNFSYLFQKDSGAKVLIYGAGRSGQELALSLLRRKQVNIVGFLDDDKNLQGSGFKNHKVYNPDKLSSFIEQKNITEVLLALPSINRRRRNQIIKNLSEQKLIVRTLPSYSDLSVGRCKVNDLMELSVVDLLAREPVAPNPELISRDIVGKVIMVTGSGGSIGGELSRQVTFQKPRKIILLDHSEYSLYVISEEIKSIIIDNKLKIELCVVLCSITDFELLSQIFLKYKPDTIYHAAAYKHVHIVQDNIFIGLKNNVLGTHNLAKLAIKYRVKNFIFVSSDKAVRPANIMGASKRFAEMVLQAFSSQQKTTIFSIVRFGNVLDSSGSVVPLFRKQVESGGPVTITHKEVTRYFMTISEAAQLVIQAGAMTTDYPEHGDSSPIYLLDMGEPVKIIDLAERIIKLSGLTAYNAETDEGDIETKFIGLRPGEKLYEELLIGNSVAESEHAKIMFAHEVFVSFGKMSIYLDQLSACIKTNDQKGLDELLVEVIPEYSLAPKIEV